MAIFPRILSAAAAVVCAAAPARAESPAPASPPPASPKAELDVVVETGLLTPAAHRQSYLETMLEYARQCLGGLVPEEPHPAGSPPQIEARPVFVPGG
ncbi:MAG: hypothetical protein R6X20_18865 [Phycisphaerae bacterium]